MFKNFYIVEKCVESLLKKEVVVIIDLDYSVKDARQRVEFVKSAVSECKIDRCEAVRLADYMLFSAEKDSTKKERCSEYPITTKNREVTHSKRNVSLDAMGTDCIMQPCDGSTMSRDPITEWDISHVPGIAENMKVAESLKRQIENADGKRKSDLKCQLIQTYRDNYLLRSMYRGSDPHKAASSVMMDLARIPLTGDSSLGRDGMPVDDGMVSLFDPLHISCLLSWHDRLKLYCENDLDSDLHWLMIDLDDLIKRTFCRSAKMMSLVGWKMDGFSNSEIARMMYETYGESHSEQYYSSLWTKRVPKMIAERAQMEWLMRHWKGPRKTCGRCGKRKPSHQLFFGRNSGSDGFYSICRKCRSKGDDRNA